MSKKVLMIIAKDGFRDEELKEPKDILTNAGMEIVVAAGSLGTAKGVLGASAKIDKTIDEINAPDYDAVVFVGGAGAVQYWDNPIAHNIANTLNNEGKPVCAICIGPVILANTGLLVGKKATVWPTEAEALKKVGAIYTGNAVEIDGNIITANGPTAAGEFGRAILGKLK